MLRSKVTKSEEWITNTTLTTGQHLTVARFLQAFDGSPLAFPTLNPPGAPLGLTGNIFRAVRSAEVRLMLSVLSVLTCSTGARLTSLVGSSDAWAPE